MVDDGCERPMLRASRAKLANDRARVVWTRQRLGGGGWLEEHDHEAIEGKGMHKPGQNSATPCSTPKVSPAMIQPMQRGHLACGHHRVGGAPEWLRIL